MQNLYLRLLLVLLFTCTASANSGFNHCLQFGPGEQGSGAITVETRTFSGITGVDLATDGTMKIELGNSEELRIETDDNLQQYVTADVDDSILVITCRKNIRPSRGLRLHLKVKRINSVTASSSGDILVPALQQDNIRLRASSSGDITSGPIKSRITKIGLSSSGDIKVHALMAERLEVSLSSSGDCSILKGRVMNQYVQISSSGDYLAKNLESQVAEVYCSSSGGAEVRVSKSLDASATSSGDIFYTGKPAKIRLSASSSGEIKAR